MLSFKAQMFNSKKKLADNKKYLKSELTLAMKNLEDRKAMDR